jgi:hypothetical protein
MLCRVAATVPRLPEATDPSGFVEIFNGGHVDPHRARAASQKWRQLLPTTNSYEESAFQVGPEQHFIVTGDLLLCGHVIFAICQGAGRQEQTWRRYESWQTLARKDPMRWQRKLGCGGRCCETCDSDIRIIMVIPVGFIPMGWPARSIPAARHAVA